jgi:hypothetical protein
MMTHKFAIGQILNLLPSRTQSARQSSQCEILHLLPFEGHSVQYRVQSLIEKHQRIVSEGDLRLVAEA